MQVKQFTLVMPHELHFQVVHRLLNEHLSQTLDYKVLWCSFLVYFLIYFNRLVFLTIFIEFLSGGCFLYNCNGNIPHVSSFEGYETECQGDTF